MPKPKATIQKSFCVEKGLTGNGEPYTSIIQRAREVLFVRPMEKDVWGLWVHLAKEDSPRLLSTHKERDDAEKAMFEWFLENVL